MRAVSIIIATYNRCISLKDTLKSLLKQEIGNTFTVEVIVVDNNSADRTRETVEAHLPEFNQTPSLKLKYLFEPKQGKPNALNTGITEAIGDYIVFTDDDVILDPKWISSIVSCFETYKCDGVGGRVLPTYPENTPNWIRGDKNKLGGIVVTYDYDEITKKYDRSMDKFIGANYAFKKEVFTACGLFRTDLSTGRIPVGEDREFIGRILKRNKSLYYCGQALVWHPVDLNRAKLKYIIKWNIALGRAAAHKEFENHTDPIVYWLGVPRYLVKGVIFDFLLIFVSIFNRKFLFQSLRKFFRKVGMIAEYRILLDKKTIKESNHASGQCDYTNI